MDLSAQDRRRGYSHWLRTGHWPTLRGAGGTEVKFNPWHDPEDGRFTFAGSGHRVGQEPTARVDHAHRPATRTHSRDDPAHTRVGAQRAAETRRVERLAEHANNPGYGDAVTLRHEQHGAAAKVEPHHRLDPATEFVGGVGQGLYGVAAGTAKATYAALTTNPVDTVRGIGGGIAEMIDTAIAAEDTPARVQVARAADMVANASSREIGRASGSVVGNAALAIGPSGALMKVSALRRLRKVMPRTSYDPPQIGWVKETQTSTEPWKAYNDSAPNSRPGQAPTLMRTMPDGSRRPVKFDGIQGEFPIDRKWSVHGRPRAVAQILRQSEVLAQHRLFATWEVRNLAQRHAANKLFKKLHVTNIKVRVVEP